MQKYVFWIIWIFLSSYQITFAAEGTSGITYSYAIHSQAPSDLHGSRFSFWYQPALLSFSHLKIILDGSLGYWWINNDNYENNKLNIFSLAPIFRYYMFNNDYISPFVDASIGFSYLSGTRIADRNLGIVFSFQDQLGLGLSFGKAKRFSLSLSALHYSNASLCGTNAGITVPLLLNLGYRF